MKHTTLFQVLRVSFAFGAFQTLMPVLGWLAGRTVIEFIESFDHWLALALLTIVGGRMLWEATHEKESHKKVDITRGILLITLSIATSIDALAVGLTFAFLKVNIALASSLIGIIAFSITGAGFIAGRKIGKLKLVDKYAEAIGGVILIAIGLRILLSQIL